MNDRDYKTALMRADWLLNECKGGAMKALLHKAELEQLATALVAEGMRRLGVAHV